jgi:transcriptional regulator with XRE-family HTH domain
MKERVHSDLYRQIGATLREWRTDLGLTQAALADRLVLDASDIGKVERGVREITFPALIRFCDALDDAALAAPSSPPQMPNSRRFRVALLNAFATALGIPAPQFTVTPEPEVTPEDTPEIQRLLRILSVPMTRQSLQRALDLKAEKNFRLLHLRPAIRAGLITMTIPSKPNSRLQKYRLTPKGVAYLNARKPKA